MHPIFQRPARLLAFLGAAAAAGLLLSGLLEALTPGSIGEALELGVPLTLLFAFQCLATWYPARPSRRRARRLRRLVARPVASGGRTVGGGARRDDRPRGAGRAVRRRNPGVGGVRAFRARSRGADPLSG